jgi:hypothetical protein
MFTFPILAKRWSVSELTLRRAAARKDIRTVYFAGRRLVPRSEVERIDLVGVGPGRKNKAAAQ